mmetsp:Transcript_3562/g.5272  ORF Transcript_3562/g.5272 Transcript_3562/m.5272 type:complete len:700 (-) Transcript_3562:324-2423(-)
MSNTIGNKNMFTMMKFRSKKKLEKDQLSSSLLLDNILESKKFDERYVGEVGDDQSAHSFDQDNAFSRDSFAYKDSQNISADEEYYASTSKVYDKEEVNAKIRTIRPLGLNESIASDSDSSDDDLYVENEDVIDIIGHKKVGYDSPLYDKTEIFVDCDLLDGLDVSVDIIDQIMDENEESEKFTREHQKQDDDNAHTHEDSHDLLNQLHTALSIPKNPLDVLKNSLTVEDDIENTASETDRLQQQLKESIAKRKMLQQKLARVKGKEQNLEEIREKVRYLSNRERSEADILKVAPAREIYEKKKEGSRKEYGNNNAKEGVINERQQLQKSIAKRKSLQEKLALKRGSGQNTEEIPNDALSPNIRKINGGLNDKAEQFVIEDEIINNTEQTTKPRNASYREKLRRSILKVNAMEAMGDRIRDDSNYEIEYEDIETFTEVNENFQTSVQQVDMQGAEIMELRSRLQDQQEEIETLEQERDFQASKIAELTELLKMSDEKQVQDHLTQKSFLVAELGHEVTTLRQKLAKAQAKSTGLESALDAKKRAVRNLSEDIWSMESPKGESADVAQSLMKNGGVIPQTHALEMTIANLQKKIEVLEEEKAHYMSTVEELNASVTKLSYDNEARRLKISKLESNFLSMNKRENLKITSEDSDIEPVEKSNRLKSWANNRMNKAQEKFETIKQDMEIRKIKNPDQILPSEH